MLEKAINYQIAPAIRDLTRQIKSISPKMLIQTLRNLERCGLVERIAYPTVPPKVEYSLTSLGESLVEPLASLGEWSYRHLKDIKLSISQYDSINQVQD